MKRLGFLFVLRATCTWFCDVWSLNTARNLTFNNLKWGHGGIKLYLLMNLHNITISYIKYHILGQAILKLQHLLQVVPPWTPSTAASPYPRLWHHRQDNLDRNNGLFIVWYIYIGNDRIWHFLNICTSQSWMWPIMGACFQFEIFNLRILPVTSQPPYPAHHWGERTRGHCAYWSFPLRRIDIKTKAHTIGFIIWKWII